MRSKWLAALLTASACVHFLCASRERDSAGSESERLLIEQDGHDQFGEDTVAFSKLTTKRAALKKQDNNIPVSSFAAESSVYRLRPQKRQALLRYAQDGDVFSKYATDSAQEKLGSGATSVVYPAALCGSENYRYAIKEVAFGGAEVVFTNILSELHTLQLMRGARYGVQYVESFVALDDPDRPDRLYIVMERARGTRVSDIVDTKGFYGIGWILPDTGEIFTELALRDVVHGLLTFLAVLHARGIVHNDIKPENILVGAHFEPTVVDFGFAVKLGAPDECIADYAPSTAAKGTDLFVCPESVRSGQCLSTAKDVWALGIVVLMLARNATPYDAWDEVVTLALSKNPRPFFKRLAGLNAPPVSRASMSRLSRELQDFILRCLDPDPATRATASDLLEHPFVTRRVDEVEESGLFSLFGCISSWCVPPQRKSIHK